MLKTGLLLAFLMVIVGTSGCSVAAQNSDDKISKVSNEEFIVGTWRLDGELPPNNTGHPFHWFLEYTFSKEGTFMLTGYPPLMQKGKYRVVKSVDEKLTLELYEQSGNFGTKDKTIEVKLDQEKGVLIIDGKEGFKRAKKE